MKVWEKELLESWWPLNVLDTRKAREYVRYESDKILFRVDALLGFSYSSLFTKDGRLKKMDSSNRIKPLHDGLSTLLGVDDNRFFTGVTKPCLIESESECIAIKIRKEKIRSQDMNLLGFW